MKSRALISPRDENPGPGNYEPSYTTAKGKPPAYPFGEKYKGMKPTEVPGPG